MVETLGLENVPDNIWNCDETDLQDRLLSTRVFWGLCWRERWNHDLASISAAGKMDPWWCYLKTSRWKQTDFTGLLRISLRRCPWRNAGLLKSGFCKASKKNDQQPHLLLVNGRTSDVFNIKFLNMTRENNMLCAVQEFKTLLEAWGTKHQLKSGWKLLYYSFNSARINKNLIMASQTTEILSGDSGGTSGLHQQSHVL